MSNSWRGATMSCAVWIAIMFNFPTSATAAATTAVIPGHGMRPTVMPAATLIARLAGSASRTAAIS